MLLLSWSTCFCTMGEGRGWGGLGLCLEHPAEVCVSHSLCDGFPHLAPGQAKPLCLAPSTAGGAQQGCGLTTLLLLPGAPAQGMGLARHFRLDSGLPLPAALWWVLNNVQ